MSFVSYAQNLEDVILWRALKDIENGFYIDVGAHHPVIDSVTKAFYEHGFRGINIEPLDYCYQQLMEDRKEDINLNLAIANNIGTQTFFEIDGLSTLSSAIADRHKNNGIEHRLIQVPVARLADICEKYCKEDIHFLKIDVEGTEADVLQSMDFKKYRPWIVVVEATIPNTQESIHKNWEDCLIQAHYECVYKDGLNRFYLADEQSHLKPRFEFPPNIFDDTVFYKYIHHEELIKKMKNEIGGFKKIFHECEKSLKLAEKSLYESMMSVKQLKRTINPLQHHLNFYRNEYFHIINSKSWKLTAPMRRVLALFKRRSSALAIPPSENELFIEDKIDPVDLMPDSKLPVQKQIKSVFRILERSIINESQREDVRCEE